MNPHLRSTRRWTSLALLVAAVILLVILASIVLVSLTLFAWPGVTSSSKPSVKSFDNRKLTRYP